MSDIPGAASVLMRSVLVGPPKPARILGSGPSCVYLDVAGDLLPVETADALGLPRAVRLAVSSRAGPFVGVRPGMPGFVGGGSVDLPGARLRVSRWWAPRRTPGVVLPERLARLAAELPRPSAEWEPGRGVADLLGRGPGLTPAGDDVIAGMLVGSRSSPTVHARFVSELERAGAGRTTSLSSALLRDAAQGYAIPAVIDLMTWLGGGDDRTVEDVTAAVLRVGHTSGLALVWGVVTGARRALDEREEAA